MSDLTPTTPFVQACQEALDALKAATTEAEKAEAKARLRAVLVGNQRPLGRDWQKAAANDAQES